MKPHVLTFRLALLGVGALVACVAVPQAYAQLKIKGPAPSVRTTYTAFVVDSRPYWASGSVSKSEPRLEKPAALAGFHFDFGDGDHKLKAIGLAQSRGGLTATFSDNDGNDVYRYSAHYVSLPDGISIRETSKERCGAACYLSIQITGDEKFALLGFDLSSFLDGDYNVGELTIDPQPSRGHVRVVFKDWGANIGYRVRIQYAAVPSRYVAGEGGGAADRYSKESSVAIRKNRNAESRQSVLQGFSFRFTNGDHHIKTISARPRAGEYRIMFNDNNTDDSYQSEVYYLVLR